MPLLHRDGGRVLCVGHRGAPALAAENTLASFRAAVGLGVDLVELDVEALADGTLVVAHSLDLDELSHGRARGSGAGASLAELRRVAPDLPTLDEALAFFADEAHAVGIHLDLKAVPHAAAVAERVVAHGLVGRSVVSSTDRRALRAAVAGAPGVQVGLTYPHDRHGISRRRSLAPLVALGLRGMRAAAPVRLPRLARSGGADAAFVHHTLIGDALVSLLHRHGLAVLAWTIDDPGDVERVVRAGIDGVISNDPSMVLATLAA